MARPTPRAGNDPHHPPLAKGGRGDLFMPATAHLPQNPPHPTLGKEGSGACKGMDN